MRLFARCVLLASLLSTSPAVAAGRAALTSTGVQLLDDRGERLADVPTGPATDALWRGDHLYVALVAGGVEVWKLAFPAAPQKVGRFAEGRAVARLVLADATLVLLENRQEATVYGLEDPARPTLGALSPGRAAAPQLAVTEAPAAAAPVLAPTVAPVASDGPSARVVAIRGGRVIFDVGTAQGLKPGVRVRIRSQRQVQIPDLATGGTRTVASNEITAVMQIDHADAKNAQAVLGRGDIAEPGDLADLTTDPVSGSTFMPRRAPFSVRTGFHVRPYLGLGDAANGQAAKTFGLLADLYGSYYFDGAPVRVEVAASPVGFAVGGLDAHRLAVLSGTVAYVTDYFEIGLGGGMLGGIKGPCAVTYSTPPTDKPVPTDFVPVEGPVACEVNTGATVNQVLRLGALDGLNFIWQSSIFSRPNAFTFGVGRGELNLPITNRLGLFGAGGAGENGWAFGELGIRTYLGGSGSRGTLLISASLGVTSIFDGPTHETVLGPSVAYGMEWRL